jgi:hypothetical protein
MASVVALLLTKPFSQVGCQGQKSMTEPFGQIKLIEGQRIEKMYLK